MSTFAHVVARRVFVGGVTTPKMMQWEAKGLETRDSARGETTTKIAPFPLKATVGVARMRAEGAPDMPERSFLWLKPVTLEGSPASFFSKRGSRSLPHHEQKPDDADNHQQFIARSVDCRGIHRRLLSAYRPGANRPLRALRQTTEWPIVHARKRGLASSSRHAKN